MYEYLVHGEFSMGTRGVSRFRAWYNRLDWAPSDLDWMFKICRALLLCFRFGCQGLVPSNKATECYHGPEVAMSFPAFLG